MREVYLEVEEVAQDPSVDSVGTCLDSSVAAALGYLFPDEPPSVKRVRGWVTREDGYTRKNWRGIRVALERAVEEGYRIEFRPDLVRPQPPDPWQDNWKYWTARPYATWTRRLEAWLSAGWVAITEVEPSGTGQWGEKRDGHAVLLDGVRTELAPLEEGTGDFEKNTVHVVDSAGGTGWVRVHDLIHDHGAAGWWLLRRDER